VFLSYVTYYAAMHETYYGWLFFTRRLSAATFLAAYYMKVLREVVVTSMKGNMITKTRTVIEISLTSRSHVFYQSFPVSCASHLHNAGSCVR
jgi:hypothetical protein